MSRLIKLTALLVAAMLVLSSCGLEGEHEEITQTEPATQKIYTVIPSDRELIKAVWLNYEEIGAMSSGGEEAFRKNVDSAFFKIKQAGFNRVIAHVRAFSDAFYPSGLFPFSKYLSGTQGADPGFDALKIMTEAAHAHSLKIDAWINPYRVSYDSNPSHLYKGSPAFKYLQSDRERGNVIVLEGGIFYNPASAEVRRLILDGIREIIDGYNVDGIHFDDYFYPSKEPAIDLAQYNAYRAAGGKLSQDNWRRENVNALISGVYSLLKQKSPQLVFSVSPGGDIEKNYYDYYADVALWSTRSGYVDVIMPQLYYGFYNGHLPFEKALEGWISLVKSSDVKLCIGLAFYKCGTVDEFAGEGRDEWTQYTNILQRQLQIIKLKPDCDGFAAYSYSHIFSDRLNPIARQELEYALEEILN